MDTDTEISGSEVTLPGRGTIHVFRNRGDTISIDQDSETERQASLIVVTTADVPLLIAALRKIAKHIRDVPSTDAGYQEPAHQ